MTPAPQPIEDGTIGALDSGGSTFGIAAIACVVVDFVLLMLFVASGMNANLRYLNVAMALIFVPGPLALLLAVVGLFRDRKKAASVVGLLLGIAGTVLLFSIGR